MKRILFVDDEEATLAGLQRLLRPQRRQWEMVFVSSGQAALDTLAETHFDVIVSDMRMPRMDGVTLLKAVQERYPHMVRIVLSGHIEVEATLRMVPVAHQFLSKPCDPALLKEVVDRACTLQALLSGEALRAVVSQLGDLPTQPQIYTALTQLLANPDVAMNDVARVIEQDIAMSAKCLQLVNSAFFGLPRRITSIQQAVSYLGISTLKSLVFSTAAFQAFEGSQRPAGFSYEALQSHSLLVARLAGRLLPEKAQADEAFLVGMLHDVGKLVLAARLPRMAAEAIRVADEHGRPLQSVEIELLGVSHAEIGAYLLGLWGLPQSVVEAVAFHHAPPAAGPRGFDALGAVYVANRLAHELSAGPGEPAAPWAALDREYLAAAGVVDQVAAWQALAGEIAGLAPAGV